MITEEAVEYRQRKEDLFICCWLLGWSDSVDLSLHAVRGGPVPPRGEGQPHGGGRAGQNIPEEGQPPPLEHHRWEPNHANISTPKGYF